ncbi:intraflagellar transport complex B protein 46 C terminal-domain-containing protein [Polychytrium aggregatum]|uniref:intraflagellar transport complex B protein 46 C terminal-domain-containing protein n=1 Tax=Polychytrium aggregatum TaxID=110093 RepID=UPI0022FDBFA1|nr:intraflagellar transport complex B protein 46 C terminal-domain-containing protein [Polychytrium aggregatum]KAI9204270.1 intraflagellar transport complex B protein 46 C terminal-domain-containing protein [Polychytrium aggregatum]
MSDSEEEYDHDDDDELYISDDNIMSTGMASKSRKDGMEMGKYSSRADGKPQDLVAKENKPKAGGGRDPGKKRHKPKEHGDPEGKPKGPHGRKQEHDDDEDEDEDDDDDEDGDEEDNEDNDDSENDDHDDERDDDDDDLVEGSAQNKDKNSGMYASSAFKDLAVGDDIKELFQYISRYKPQDMDVDTLLKPFIPDYIPSIGDIDAFIKIPRPDHKPEALGLMLLDEPNGRQSDPTVLDLTLRAVTKSSAPIPQIVRSIDAETLRTKPKRIDAWIESVKELHAAKPPLSVAYSKRMPDIEDLMQVWPPEIEAAVSEIVLPSPAIDLALPLYVQLINTVLDIPVSTVSSKPGPQRPSQPPPQSHAMLSAGAQTIESLHVLFTLYSEFKNSHHFKALQRMSGDSQMELGLEGVAPAAK